MRRDTGMELWSHLHSCSTTEAMRSNKNEMQPLTVTLKVSARGTSWFSIRVGVEERGLKWRTCTTGKL